MNSLMSRLLGEDEDQEAEKLKKEHGLPEPDYDVWKAQRGADARGRTQGHAAKTARDYLKGLKEDVVSSDVVPVVANLPRKTYRDRTVKARQHKDDSVKRLVGEAREDEVIPQDAEPIDRHEMTVGKPLRDPKEIVQEPSHPADKEKYQTPYAALTAPDVTPKATEPIDPSQAPGSTGAEKFTAADLERAPGVEGGDMASRTMDILLGRNRAAKPATQPGEFEQAGAIATEEEAAAAMGIRTPIQEEAHAKAANLMVPAKDGGQSMPPPTPAGDGSAIFSTFRRFNG